jgi:hypothetical protein
VPPTEVSRELAKPASASPMVAVRGMTRVSKRSRRLGAPNGLGCGGGEGRMCHDGEPYGIESYPTFNGVSDPGGEPGDERRGFLSAGFRRADAARATSPDIEWRMMEGRGFCWHGRGPDASNDRGLLHACAWWPSPRQRRQHMTFGQIATT